MDVDSAVRNGPPPSVDRMVAAARAVDDFHSAGITAARRLEEAGRPDLAHECRAVLANQVDDVRVQTTEFTS